MSIEERFSQQSTLHVAILVFPDVEVLDFAGPFEVFSVASRIAARPAPFTVSLVGETGGSLSARHGMGVVPHYGFHNVPPVDLLIVPGGVMTEPLANPATLAWVKHAHAQAALTASVCTGAFVLAKLGIVDGYPVTTHWADIAALREAHPALEVREQVPYVDNGALITSAGISAGIGMSLHLVRRILGAVQASATARQMEYDWQP